MKGKLLNERLHRIKTAIKRDTSDKVPFIISTTYRTFYYGCGINDAYNNNPALVGEIHMRLGEDFPCDKLYSIGAGNHVLPSPLRRGHITADPMGLQVSNTTCQQKESDEYDEFISDSIKYFRGVLLPRKLELSRRESHDEALDVLNKSYEKFLFYSQKSKRGMDAVQESGLTVLIEDGAMHPLDIILDFCRDFQGMTDIRRRHDKVILAAASLTQFLLKSVFDNYKGSDDGRSLYCPSHIPTYLNQKQFEKFYFP